MGHLNRSQIKRLKAQAKREGVSVNQKIKLKSCEIQVAKQNPRVNQHAVCRSSVLKQGKK